MRSRRRSRRWRAWRSGGEVLVSVAEDALRVDRVIAAVAERVAAQQAPDREHHPAGYAFALNRLDGIARASGLVLASPRQKWREDSAIQGYWRAHQGPRGARQTTRRGGVVAL